MKLKPHLIPYSALHVAPENKLYVHVGWTCQCSSKGHGSWYCKLCELLVDRGLASSDSFNKGGISELETGRQDLATAGTFENHDRKCPYSLWFADPWSPKVEKLLWKKLAGHLSWCI